LKSGRFPLDIRLFYLSYPADILHILISGEQISNKFLPLGPPFVHGKKGFVIPTKSFVKIGITKIFCYNNKRLVAAVKFLVAATKILMVSLILLP